MLQYRQHLVADSTHKKWMKFDFIVTGSIFLQSYWVSDKVFQNMQCLKSQTHQKCDFRKHLVTLDLRWDTGYCAPIRAAGISKILEWSNLYGGHLPLPPPFLIGIRLISGFWINLSAIKLVGTSFHVPIYSDGPCNVRHPSDLWAGQFSQYVLQLI